MNALPHARHFIDGAWTESGTVGESTDPATGEVLGTFADGGAPEARAAIDAARRAFETGDWARDRDLRARALFEMSDRMAERRDELVGVLSRENGKIPAEAALEVDLTISKIRYYGALALTESGRASEVKPGLYSMTLRQPAGVAGVIAPWNSPVILSVRSFAPALAAGATVALKLPAQTALTNSLLYEIVAATTALPRGVFNAFTESGSSGARLIVADPGVDVISYTGSTHVGRSIMADASASLKGMSLELGGKTPMIVFDDADLDAAVPVLTKAITTFTGQFCMTGSRILVQRGIADALRTRLSAALEAVRVGPGTDPTSEMGPLIDRANADRVERRSPTPPSTPGSWCGAAASPTGRWRRERSCAPRWSRSTRWTGPSCSRRSSAPSPPSRSSTTRRTPSPAPTPPSSASPRASGPATWTVRCASAGSWRRARSGPTPGQ